MRRRGRRGGGGGQRELARIVWRKRRWRGYRHGQKKGAALSLFLPFLSFLFGSRRTGRRGPGRTILLDLCARAISRSSRDLPRATNVAPITVLFVLDTRFFRSSTRFDFCLDERIYTKKNRILIRAYRMIDAFIVRSRVFTASERIKYIIIS